MAKEQVTVNKTFVKYFVEITQNAEVTNEIENEETGEVTQEVTTAPVTTYYEFETNDEDYSPFIEYDETTWDQIEKLPEDEVLWNIKKIKVPFIDEETQEESTVEYIYYYAYYEKEVTVDKFIKGICTACLFCVTTNRCHRKYECANPEHIVKWYVNGFTRNGDCRDYNSNGECRLFSPIPLEDEVPDDPIDEPIEEPGDDTGDVVPGTDPDTDEILGGDTTDEGTTDVTEGDDNP